MAVQKGATREFLLADLVRGHEREQATRSILEVIDRSREDEGPVEDDYQVETGGKLSLKGLRDPRDVFRLVGGAAA
ncbi:hypothetical protein FGK63_05615 [Ruegeria sediminis]|uniref:Uncharacterized protein n=1 Tax=Ruegeria sediminis TaxID=2583820 RepID=A0ABY2X0Z4_9RHOB|nr:hypothetical protein [Ruegeria sediminis]TMV08599.1 hypothetical protein FGK63_05615 [Ruegeria sediminis]